MEYAEILKQIKNMVCDAKNKGLKCISSSDLLKLLPDNDYFQSYSDIDDIISANFFEDICLGAVRIVPTAYSCTFFGSSSLGDKTIWFLDNISNNSNE